MIQVLAVVGIVLLGIIYTVAFTLLGLAIFWRNS